MASLSASSQRDAALASWPLAGTDCLAVFFFNTCKGLPKFEKLLEGRGLREGHRPLLPADQTPAPLRCKRYDEMIRDSVTAGSPCRKDTRKPADQRARRAVASLHVFHSVHDWSCLDLTEFPEFAPSGDFSVETPLFKLERYKKDWWDLPSSQLQWPCLKALDAFD